MEGIVTGDAKPSDIIIAAAKQPVVVTDERGRKISIRKMSLLDRMRLIEGLGPAADNGTYLNYAAMIASVVSIDGTAESIIQRKEQVEAMASRLDNDGFDAVVDGYNANFKKAESGDPAAIKK